MTMNGNTALATGLAPEDALRQLQDRFDASLEVRLMDIEQASLKCARNNDAASFHLLMDHVHKLAGVAASFGYLPMGDLARTIDTLIAKGLAEQQDHGWRDIALARTEELMDLIELALENNLAKWLNRT